MTSVEHAKHLNTPRLVADDTQKTVWKWEQQEPFGAGACNPDPDGDNVQFEFNLRFPGQYFDRETNLHYNYFRDYDPSLGRYVERDPIGVRGGLNIFAYVASDPLSAYDRLGLSPRSVWRKIWEGLIKRREEAEASAGTELFEGIHTDAWVKAGVEIGTELCKTPRITNFADICMEKCVDKFPRNNLPSGGGGGEFSQCVDSCVRTFEKCRQRPQSRCPTTPQS